MSTPPAPSAFPTPANRIVISTAPFKSEKVDRVIVNLKKAYSAIGYEAVVITEPGERSLLNVNSGVNDAELHRIPGIEKNYPHLVRVKIPLARNFHHAFVKDARFQVKGYESLRPYKISFTKGFKAIERGTEGFSVYPLKDDPAAFHLLDLGRVDVVVTDKEDGLRLVEKQNFKNIRILEPAVETIELFHYVNEKHRNLIPGLEAALRDVPVVQ